MKPEKLDFARQMRRSPTPSEGRVWQAVRRRQLGPVIRRQVPMLGYIADFYCAKAKLVIEIDGMIHEPAYDRHRDDVMQQHGFRILRFTNEQVQRDFPGVLESIRAAL